ncbi:uncharacterized protein LOC106884335 [Octopus bimaculoides]|uniref:Partner and localiser of BRCA2 WD40 domain-containing protein n=1 Tax=Octopus bimaculoides TaxID=37653 RepID=A0A0L8I3D6_OCTBM|nr:uncharacterized protein LOC106884335 [Octopus bimaculoides]|eukprot:XP_014791157.1 PREDICTED: uncharacterized protein LOC106884335 [Octopus bimaculoides]
MEKEELYKQLLLMKKEYARKKKKLELAIQAKNSQEVPCRERISTQLKTHPATCEMGNKEFCYKKDKINSSQVEKINNICVSEDSLKLSCKTKKLLNIPSNSIEQKTDPIKTEIASDFKTSFPLPTNSFQMVESDCQTSGNSDCSSVSLNTSKILLKTSNDTQHKWKTCLSNSFASGESTKKMTPNETSETMEPQITISTNVRESSDLVCSSKRVNEERLAVPLLQESSHIEKQNDFKHNQLEIDNSLKRSNENPFDSNHISKSDEELISSEALRCAMVNIPLKCQEVSSSLQTGDDCIKNQTALLNRKEVNNDTDSLQIINSSASLFNSDQKISSQSLQCCHLNQSSKNQPIEIMGSLSSDHTKNSDAKEKQTEILDKLVVRQFQKDPFSVCDFQTICDLKLTRTEKIPDNNEVVSLLNTSCSVSIHRDFTVCENYLVGVTKSEILFWTYTKNEDWHIIYQWKVSDYLEECSTASLHPYESAVCVAVLGLKAQMHHSLILSTFQGLSKRSISVVVTSVVSLPTNQIIYCSLNSFELAVASSSNNENTKISKIYLLEDFTAVKEQQSLESTSEKLLSLAAIQRLPAGLIGLTVTNVLLIWNHTTNLLLIKVPLTDINENCCNIPTAMNLEGHVIFPVLFKEGLQLGSFVALNPTTSTVSKLLSYEKIPHFNTSLKLTSAHVFDKTFVSFNENILGLWDLFSGYLMASIYCSNISSVTVFHSVNQLWLITSQKGGCIHWYSS